MLRTLKTNLTREDLIQPTLDIKAAADKDGGGSTSAGALVLPMQKSVSDAMAAPAKPISDDWKKQGDPTAPAIKEMEAFHLMEKQQAEAAAAKAKAAAVIQDIVPPGGAGAPAVATAPVVTTAPVRSQPDRQPYAWMPNPTAKPSTGRADDIPDIWSKPSPIDNMAPGQVPPASVAPAAPAMVPPPVASAAAAPQEMPTEGVIYIPHDPVKDIIKSDTIPAPAAKPADNFAGGGAVSIPHDSQLESLPLAPVAAPPKPTAGPL